MDREIEMSFDIQSEFSQEDFPMRSISSADVDSECYSLEDADLGSSLGVSEVRASRAGRIDIHSIAQKMIGNLVERIFLPDANIASTDTKKSSNISFQKSKLKASAASGTISGILDKDVLLPTLGKENQKNNSNSSGDEEEGSTFLIRIAKIRNLRPLLLGAHGYSVNRFLIKMSLHNQSTVEFLGDPCTIMSTKSDGRAIYFKSKNSSNAIIVKCHPHPYLTLYIELCCVAENEEGAKEILVGTRELRLDSVKQGKDRISMNLAEPFQPQVSQMMNQSQMRFKEISKRILMNPILQLRSSHFSRGELPKLKENSLVTLSSLPAIVAYGMLIEQRKLDTLKQGILQMELIKQPVCEVPLRFYPKIRESFFINELFNEAFRRQAGKRRHKQKHLDAFQELVTRFWILLSIKEVATFLSTQNHVLTAEEEDTTARIVEQISRTKQQEDFVRFLSAGNFTPFKTEETSLFYV